MDAKVGQLAPITALFHAADLLGRLAVDGPLSITRLSRGTGVTRQAITKHLHTLGANSLVIEGTSDFIYISALSRHLEGLGRSHLDLRRWTLTSVGGTSGVPTFVALLGSRLNVTVLVDAGAKVNQRLTDMVAKGLLESQRLVTVCQAIGKARADIEDFFTPDEYVALYNKAFGTSVKAPDLPPGDSQSSSGSSNASECSITACQPRCCFASQAT
jgi:hypothetical protein